MKIILDGKAIKLSRIKSVDRIGGRVAIIRFKTGKFIPVLCGIRFPEKWFVSYKGSYEELK